jgi:hypothetical protein
VADLKSESVADFKSEWVADFRRNPQTAATVTPAQWIGTATASG